MGEANCEKGLETCDSDELNEWDKRKTRTVFFYFPLHLKFCGTLGFFGI